MNHDQEPAAWPWPPACSRRRLSQLSRRRGSANREGGKLSRRRHRRKRATMVIAVPYMPTPQDSDTPAGSTDALGRQVAEVVAADLARQRPVPAGRVRSGFAPIAYRRSDGAGLRCLGRHRRRRAGPGLRPRQSGRPAHRRLLSLRRRAQVRADPRRAMSSRRATGAGPRTNAPTPSTRACRAKAPSSTAASPISPKPAPRIARVKRLAIMDSDGANHRFLTNGQSIVLTPRFSPDYKQIVYLSYVEQRPRIYIYDIGTGRQRLVTESANQTFAPRFSPDGRCILYSMAVGGNTDIYRVSANGGTPRAADQLARHRRRRQLSRPTAARIVFESDRSGSQQLYVMNADGSNQRRISFGGGALCHARMEPARRSDRLHPDRRQFPRRGDDARRRRRAAADRQLAGRGADLVAQRPRHPVLPHQPGPRRQVERLAGRSDRPSTSAGSRPRSMDPIQPGDRSSHEYSTERRVKMKQTGLQGRGDRRRAGADRRLRQEAAQGAAAAAGSGTEADAATASTTVRNRRRRARSLPGLARGFPAAASASRPDLLRHRQL